MESVGMSEQERRLDFAEEVERGDTSHQLIGRGGGAMIWEERDEEEGEGERKGHYDSQEGSQVPEDSSRLRSLSMRLSTIS